MLSPLQCPAMAWWRVHSRDGSQQAMHMRLHIYDTLCSVQLSHAILAGFAFSCTTIHLSCHVQGCSDTCSVQCCHMDGSCTALTLFHIVWIGDTNTHNHNFLRWQPHNAWPRGGPGPRDVVYGCRQFASVEMSPHQWDQSTVYTAQPQNARIIFYPVLYLVASMYPYRQSRLIFAIHMETLCLTWWMWSSCPSVAIAVGDAPENATWMSAVVSEGCMTAITLKHCCDTCLVPHASVSHDLHNFKWQ